MRVLVVANRASVRGGADWHLVTVLDELTRRPDVEVRLVVGRDEGGFAPSWPVDLLPGLEDVREREVVGLDAMVDSWRPDIVHLHNVMNPWVLEWGASREAMITIQDHRIFCPYRGMWRRNGTPCTTPLAQEQCAQCLPDATYRQDMMGLTSRRLAAVRKLSAVTVLSHYMKTQLVEVGVDSSRVHVVPPFVSDVAPPPTRVGDCVLFVGRLAAAKGVDEALEAWRRSKSALRFVFVGTGPERARLSAQAQVTGWVDRPQLRRWYGRAAAVVFPSRWQEPFGIVGLEALTAGVPVAAWRSGGVDEWHPGGDGLVGWGDIDGLAAALSRLIGSEAAQPAGFDCDASMDRLIEVYGAAA